MNQDSVSKFDFLKQQLGFAQLPPPTAAGSSVVLEWPELNEFTDLNESWQKLLENLWWEHHGVVRRQIFANGKARLVFTLYLTLAGEQAARDYLLNALSQTSMPTIDYHPAPFQVGELCLLNSIDPATSLVCLWRNVVFKWDILDGTIDLPAIAKALDAILVSHYQQEVKEFLPKPQDIIISSLQESLTKLIDIDIVFPSEQISRYKLQLEYDSSKINILNLTDQHISLTGLKSGKSQLQLHLIDKKTLLSKTEVYVLSFS